MRRSRVAWTAECSETASVNCSGSSAKRRIPGMSPQVETVRWRAPMPTSVGGVHEAQRAERGVVVGERLALAHRHGVGDALAEVVGDEAHLVDHLAGAEVAREAAGCPSRRTSTPSRSRPASRSTR